MKKMSEYIVSYMDKKRNYSIEEITVISYGIELFLNSVIKIIVYMLIGILIGRMKEVLFSFLIWCSVRKQSGGRHAQNDSICFLISGFSIFFPVIISSYIKIIKLQIIINILVINVMYLIYAPYDEYYMGKRREAFKAKCKTILLINIIFILGIYLKRNYLYITIVILYEQGILILHKIKNILEI